MPSDNQDLSHNELVIIYKFISRFPSQGDEALIFNCKCKISSVTWPCTVLSVPITKLSFVLEAGILWVINLNEPLS